MENFFNISNPQKSLLLTEQYYQGSNINNICGTAILNNKINFEALDKAINEVIEKNDSFLIKIKQKNGAFFQTLNPYRYSRIELIKLNSKEDLTKLENETLQKVFDIEKELFEFKLFEFPDKTGGFLLNIHHVIADGWSLGLICRKIMISYSKFMGEELEDISSSYIEYLKSEEEYFSSEKFKADKNYWLSNFETIPETASIPGSLTTSEISSKANRKEFILSKNIVNSIQNFCAQNKISIFNFFTSILSVYMYKINNLNSFVIGTPILNRTNFKEKNTVGMFVNVAPLKITIDNQKNFTEFAKDIAINSKEMLRHQKYSYTNILEELRKKDSKIPGLYNIVLSYQLTKANNVSKYDYKTRWVFNGNCSEDIEIQIYDLDETGNLNIAFDYKANKYIEKDIESLYSRLLYITNQVLESDKKLFEIEFITEAEKDKILNKFNNTKTDYPKEKSVVQLFEEQVEKVPSKNAVFFENTELTYEELNFKANSIASYLVKNGAKTEDVIGIFLDKSLESIISILGILKTGCAFLPIDVAYPESRINYMLENSNTKFILTNSKFEKILNTKIKIINLDNFEFKDEKNLNLKIKPENLAYIMYTSGSTGNPKGVMVEHKNIVRLVKNTNYIKFGEDEKILQTGSIVFDACTFEIWAALLNGFELFIITKNDLLDPILLQNYINKNKISILWLTSPLFNQLSTSNPAIFENVKYLLTGGDVLSPSHINSVMEENPKLQIINGYGPTENTTFSTCFNIKEKYLDNIPIGYPIANSTCYIVNNELKLCPVGTVGELIVGGDGVSRGYLNSEKLTKEKFISGLFGEKRLYKTGDLAKWQDDGSIIFLGRADSQVKIRGNRIELSEINSKMLEFGTIKECINIVKEINGTKVICAYFTQKSATSISNLRDFLHHNLPSFMVPNYFIKLEKMPLNQNGKIDKKLLPEPNLLEIEHKEIIKPRNSTDEFLVKTLEKLLGIKEISISDSFFDLGGDSLNAINFCSIISQKFNVHLSIQDIFKTPVISDLSDTVSSLKSTTIMKIQKVKPASFYPTSSAEKRIYFSNIMSNSTVYNITGGIELSNEIDLKKVQDIFNELIKRHEILRTYFEVVDGNLVQKIVDSATVKLEKFSTKEKTIDEILKEFDKPFDLSKPPIIRIGAISGNGKYIILLSLHHIIADGTSLKILIDEFCKLYNGEKLNNLKITYKDFSSYENDLIKNDMLESKNYWINLFKDGSENLNLPLNYSRPPVFTFNGAKIYKKLDKKTVEQISKFCKTYNVTHFMFLLAIFYILLNKYSNNAEITVGTPTANRNNSDLSSVVGMFVNALPLKNQINKEDTFLKFLGNIKTNCLEAFSHQEYPFDELVKALNFPKNISRNSLFDVMFTYQNNGDIDINLNGTTAKYFKPDTNIAKYDLSLEAVPASDELELNFEYCADLFTKKFIDEFANHYIILLSNILERPYTPIFELKMLSQNEEKQIINKLNNSSLEFDKSLTIIDLFEKQVKKNPQKYAVIFEDEKLTYKELDEKSNQIANYLIKNGITNKDIIGIELDRSIEILICMLGILKTGAAYLPIDPTYPEARINYIITNSNLKFILTQPNLITENSNCKCIDAKLSSSKIYKENTEAPNITYSTENLAYVIYTSGSTGNPKGVMITVRNVVNFVNGISNVVNFKQDATIGSVTTMCFDIFVLESLLPIMTGLTTVIATFEEQTIPVKLNAMCKKNNVSVLQTTPSKLLLLLSDENALDYVKNLDCLLLGGEAFPATLLPRLQNLTKAKIFNVYGPTETTVWSFIKDLTNAKNITIGKVLPNQLAYVVDDNLNLLPNGVPGNLYIGGLGVTNGYLGRTDLTNEKFIQNPFANGKIYNTGDVVKFLPDGDIVYIGRSDFQVKINGLRIELEEIEKQILNFGDITNCAVTVKKDLNNRDILCAYLVANYKIPTSNLKSFLRKKLPSYMVPVYITQLDDFKYTANGKLDRKSLPMPKFMQSKKDIIMPETKTEKKISKIIEELLGVSPISITDNFFDIGCDSLTALRMQIDLLSENINVTYADIFKYSSIKELAIKIDSNIADETIITDDYDYSEINNLIAKNDYPALENIKFNDIGNIILTGATGYLGTHILNYLLNETDKTVYCLIRKNSKTNVEEKLLSKLRFYFENNLDKFLNNRFFVVPSDITLDNLGLSKKDYAMLSENSSCIINSAATVKHYGYYSDFEKVNVTGVKNLINFCLDNKKKFVQISTTSVSGNTVLGEKANLNIFGKDIIFDEKTLFENQSLANVYVKSKFEAEKAVLENIIKNNLDGLILRVGNISPRHSDGKFQINANDNAFMNRLRSFVELKAIPETVLEIPLEFTFVDSLAEAVVKSIEYYNKSVNILHIYNPNHLLVKDLLNWLPEHIDVISKADFSKLLKSSLQNPTKKDSISFLTNDIDKNYNLVYITDIKLKNDFTNKFLEKINFKWPKPDKSYIKKIQEILR